MTLNQQANLLINAMPADRALAELIMLQESMCSAPQGMCDMILRQWVDQQIRSELDADQGVINNCEICGGTGWLSEREMINDVREVWRDVPCPVCVGAVQVGSEIGDLPC